MDEENRVYGRYSATYRPILPLESLVLGQEAYSDLLLGFEYFGLFRDVLGASQYYIVPTGNNTCSFYFKGQNQESDRRWTRTLGFKGISDLDRA